MMVNEFEWRELYRDVIENRIPLIEFMERVDVLITENTDDVEIEPGDYSPYD